VKYSIRWTDHVGYVGWAFTENMSDARSLQESLKRAGLQASVWQGSLKLFGDS